MIRFKCPHCGGSLEALESHSGEEINCLRCGYLVQVPSQQDDYFRFSCPTCGTRLRAKPEHSRKKSHCTNCGTRFVVPPADPPGPPDRQRRQRDPEEDEQRGLSASDDYTTGSWWQRLTPAAQTGVIAAVCILLGLFMFIVIGVIAALNSGPSPTDKVAKRNKGKIPPPPGGGGKFSPPRPPGGTPPSLSPIFKTPSAQTTTTPKQYRLVWDALDVG